METKHHSTFKSGTLAAWNYVMELCKFLSYEEIINRQWELTVRQTQDEFTPTQLIQLKAYDLYLMKGQRDAQRRKKNRRGY